MMKINKKKIINQRNIIERKLLNWKTVFNDKRPPSGWIKAIRMSLGMTTSQLANLMNINQATALRYEKREVEDKLTLETLKKVAEAMDCKLIYAIVPREPNESLNEIIEDHASDFALSILKRTEHSMQLEQQGTGLKKSEVKELTQELIKSVDNRIWNIDE